MSNTITTTNVGTTLDLNAMAHVAGGVTQEEQAILDFLAYLYELANGGCSNCDPNSPTFSDDPEA